MLIQLLEWVTKNLLFIKTMKIKINADILNNNNKLIKTENKIVSVKETFTKDKIMYYIFSFKGKELKIQKKFTTLIEE